MVTVKSTIYSADHPFLNLLKIDLYDEMAIIEFIQGIFDSGSFIEEESSYLSYSPVIGYDNLHTASEKKNEEIGAPIFYVYIERGRNRVHYLPFTFIENQKEKFCSLPALKSQLEIDYYTRQFSLLDITLKKAKIVYYGINKQKKDLKLLEYIYNDSTKIFDKSGQKEKITIYAPFKKETEKMLLWVKMGDK